MAEIVIEIKPGLDRPDEQKYTKNSTQTAIQHHSKGLRN